MAYVDATAADLKAAFPRFADVAAETINYWLTRARRSVDQSWTEGDYAYGQMLLAAHYLVLNGAGTGAESEAAAAGATGFKSIRSGSLTLERFDSAQEGASGYASTSFGQQFAALLRLNRGGALVTPTGVAPYDGVRWPQGE